MPDTVFDKKKYDQQYAKENLIQMKFTVNREFDADIIEWLNKQSNKAGYIKELIRKDMENQPKQAELRGNEWWCPRCGNHIEIIHAGEFNKFCAFCGQKVNF